MAKPAPEYELILMLDPELPDDRRDAIAVDARKRIEAGAELRQERAWGLRKMAYEIQQRNEADYRFFRFASGKGVLDDLSHSLKIADGVLRFRIFKVDPRAPVIDPPPPVALAAAAPARSGSRRRDEERPPRGPEPEAPAVAEAPAATEAAAAEAPAPAQAQPATEAPAAAEPTEPSPPAPEPESAPEPDAQASEPAPAPAAGSSDDES